MFAHENHLFCLCEERPEEATWQSLQHKSACQKRLLRFARNYKLSGIYI